MKLYVFVGLVGLAMGHPGLLRVPKVYNAVVTSNQNLSPSRAVPVIQPVIHRTAIGYVPPFYYTQVAPQSALRTSEASGEPADKKEDNAGSGSRSKQGEEPLSFYPNYQSLYYDPYFYYNGVNPLIPGTYYTDYHPYGILEPIPPSTPKDGPSGHLLPGYHEEKKDTAKLEKDKVPDVPPPPLPTAVPKSS
ncbi:uncharacterized protein LOC122399830 [Colletes gigas]|uniref:uncharacterized protein LOC122399830 n=1 Tax=Colletes gigas TaxID=935657 RepID=UPI001C9B778F|nr:uncharacterized protein LOC122399830 [Colletes gigas]XP_043256761.1 uncharacterized protein LOC122399830 [Colletes gigas]